MPQGQIDLIGEAAERVRELPIEFDGSRPDLDYIISRSRQLKAANPDLSLVVVDGLQSFPGEQYKNKVDTYYHVLSTLKEMAGELGLTVIINAQLKMDVEKRKNKRPLGLDDFSDCKGIAEVADTAVMLYRPEAYWPEERAHKNKLYVLPMAMREGDKRGRDAVMRVNMKTSRLYNNL